MKVKTENTGSATDWCLEAHDLAISKLVAGREQDVRFVEALLKHGIVEVEELKGRISTLSVEASQLQVCQSRLARLTEPPSQNP